jgi:hypothetical protein
MVAQARFALVFLGFQMWIGDVQTLPGDLFPAFLSDYSTDKRTNPRMIEHLRSKMRTTHV